MTTKVTKYSHIVGLIYFHNTADCLGMRAAVRLFMHR